MYYMLSIPTEADIHTHYYLDNSEMLRYAFVSLNNMFSYAGNAAYDVTTNSAGNFDFKLSRIWHVSSVPEPSAFILLVTGIVGLGFARRIRT